MELNDGETLTGRVIRQSQDELILETDARNGTRETIARKTIKSMRPSDVSSMPGGLLNVFTREEILDLIAYLQSGGRPGASAFSKP